MHVPVLHLLPFALERNDACRDGMLIDKPVDVVSDIVFYGALARKIEASNEMWGVG